MNKEIKMKNVELTAVATCCVDVSKACVGMRVWDGGQIICQQQHSGWRERGNKQRFVQNMGTMRGNWIALLLF